MYDITRASSFNEIRDEVIARVLRGVYANLATVDVHGRVRSRVVHPVWDGSTIWISCFPDSPKHTHIAAHPYVSLAYTAETWTPMYAECRAETVLDDETKQRVWDVIVNAPPPMGFDPSPIYGSTDDPRFALIRLTPWRVQLSLGPGKTWIWQPASGSAMVGSEDVDREVQE